MNLESLLERRKRIRVIGFDDANHHGESVGAMIGTAGVICAGTRFEGMVWGHLAKDGMDATEVLSNLLMKSKFADQCHLILLDGLTFGGCNVVDLPALMACTQLPTVAVMRRHPDLEAFRHVVINLPESEERWRRVLAAGPIHEYQEFFFQVAGVEADIAGRVLEYVTDNGKVPEALRVAHLIGSAITLGQSGRRA